MTAEIFECDEARVIVSTIRAIGDRDVCFEVHRKGKDAAIVQVTHFLLSRDQFRELVADLVSFDKGLKR